MNESIKYNQVKIASLLAAINSLSLGFIFFDEGKSLILGNDSARRILGTSVSDLPELSKLLPTANIIYVCEKCVNTKSSIELKNVPFNDKFLRIVAQPIFERTDDPHTVIGFVLLVEDITHIKETEKSKEEFFTLASHELRTPLTVIRGNMAMMRKLFATEMARNAQLRKMVDDTYKASVGLIRMVNDFLNIAALEQKGFAFKKEKIDIPALTKEIVAELEPVAKMKGIYLKLSDQTKPVSTVTADPEKSKEVLFNMVSNAINYTESGGVTINVEPRKDVVEVIVEDTGLGISSENQEKLFNRFERFKEEGEVRDTTKGTGLGLYISRLLAEGMGGELNLVRSKVGAGSVFSFILPV